MDSICTLTPLGTSQLADSSTTTFSSLPAKVTKSTYPSSKVHSHTQVAPKGLCTVKPQILVYVSRTVWWKKPHPGRRPSHLPIPNKDTGKGGRREG